MAPCGFWQVQAQAKLQLWWLQWQLGYLVRTHFTQIKFWA
jgi:hypothetical protein